MSMDIRPPLITGQTVGEQVQQLIAYLTRLARQLQELPDAQPAAVAQRVETAYPGSVHKLRVRKDLTVDGGVNGVYIRKVRVWGVGEFTIRTNFAEWNSSGGLRQSFLLAGCANSKPLLGVVRISNNGAWQWSGTEGVSFVAEGAGVLRVKLPDVLYDHLLVQSPDEFYID